MFSLQQITRITNVIVTFTLILPLHCLTQIPTKQIQPKREDEDASNRMHSLKQGRRLQYTWDDDRHVYQSDSSDDSIIYLFISLFFILIGLLIKCCMKYARESENDEANRIVHPPPRISYSSPSQTYTTRTTSLPPGEENFSPRAGGQASNTRRNVLAPPSSRSRSIILPSGENISSVSFNVPLSVNENATALSPPENRSIFRRQDLENFTGIENPSFNVSTASTSNQERRSRNSTLQTNTNLLSVLDMPPSYDAVVSNESRRFSGKEFPTVFEGKNSVQPPPYEEK